MGSTKLWSSEQAYMQIKLPVETRCSGVQIIKKKKRKDFKMVTTLMEIKTIMSPADNNKTPWDLMKPSVLCKKINIKRLECIQKVLKKMRIPIRQLRDLLPFLISLRVSA